MKRTFDVAVALIGVVVTSPLVALGALAIKLESPGPAIYRSERVGRNGQPFWMYKLRTMRVNADRVGPAVTGARDPRVTSVGRFLRRTKMDELPQLFNVVRGDMSLVGPRPEAPEFVQLYTPGQQLVLSVRPGMTGPAALAYINEEEMLGEGDAEARYIKSVMPAKLNLDLEYVRSSSFAGDLKILVKTIEYIVTRPRDSSTM
jgi:lipopolysaccharide/colanic/teichoic acid biosynthesis glycosyltransferase